MKTMMRIMLKENNYEKVDNMKNTEKTKKSFVERLSIFIPVITLCIIFIVGLCLWATNRGVPAEEHPIAVITDNLVMEVEYVNCDNGTGNIVQKEIEEILSEFNKYEFKPMSEDEGAFVGTPIYYDFYGKDEAVLFTFLHYEENNTIALISMENVKPVYYNLIPKEE